jgi:hypothetical protein
MAERRFRRHPARLEAAHGGKFLQARQQATTPGYEDRAGDGAVPLRKLCGHANSPDRRPPQDRSTTIVPPSVHLVCARPVHGPIMVTPTRPATLTPLPHRSSLAALGEPGLLEAGKCQASAIVGIAWAIAQATVCCRVTRDCAYTGLSPGCPGGTGCDSWETADGGGGCSGEYVGSRDHRPECSVACGVVAAPTPREGNDGY